MLFMIISEHFKIITSYFVTSCFLTIIIIVTIIIIGRILTTPAGFVYDISTKMYF